MTGRQALAAMAKKGWIICQPGREYLEAEHSYLIAWRKCTRPEWMVYLLALSNSNDNAREIEVRSEPEHRKIAACIYECFLALKGVERDSPTIEAFLFDKGEINEGFCYNACPGTAHRAIRGFLYEEVIGYANFVGGKHRKIESAQSDYKYVSGVLADIVRCYFPKPPVLEG